MRITVHVHSPVVSSPRVREVVRMFDLPHAPSSGEAFAVELPALEEPWTIGAIVGPSGSGKTTVARAAFGVEALAKQAWPANRAVIDVLQGASMRITAHTLSAVGFGSPLAWLRPYHVLSGGERFRCDLARALASPRRLIVCDEFTSLVDRTAAQVASASLAKALRSGRFDKRFVAVTCHDDVLPWLAPDWVLDMATGRLARGSLRRPAIELRVVRARQSAWQLFARHHYLSGGLSRGATCYVALWRQRPVAFCAVIAMLGHRGHRRVTRLVTLPDFQGVGIGTRLLEYVCRLVRASGKRISITTSHPAMCAYLSASSHWRCTRRRAAHQHKRQIVRSARVRDSAGRATMSFEFL